MPQVLLICLLAGITGLGIIAFALKVLTRDVEYLTIDGKTYTILMDKCHCGARKAKVDAECATCSQVDKCECGELKAKEQSFCSKCLFELRTEGRIRKHPLPGRENWIY